MAEPQTDDQETMLASGDRDTEDSQDASTSDIQVKEEPEDTGYERASAASVLSDQNSTTDSRNSSPLPAVHFENSSPSQTRDSSPLPNQSGSSTPQSSTQIPLNDLFAGSTIRTQLQGAIAGKKMDTVQNIVEGLLKKNETLLAMSDAGGYKPNARRVRAAHDGFVKRSEPGFPPQGQSRVFPVSTRLQARMNASKRTADSLKQCMIRPKSPTRRHDGLMKDKTHFSYALMESNTADHEIEDIFSVQNHELVCAIGSKSMITDKSNKVVASLEFSYYWCNFCPFSTNNKSLLIQHVVDHRFCCKYCPYESFCRSDIVRHMNKMHQDFQEIADRMSYCTMLSDYLRVKSRLNGKENADPDEDVGDFSPDVTASSIPRTSGRKRRGEETHHEEAVPTEKAAKFDQWEKDKDKAASRKERPGKSRKSQNPKRLPPPKDTDYDMFEMEVEEISDAPTGRAAEEAQTDKIMYSSTRSPPNIQTDVPAFPTGMMQVLPTLQGGSMQTFTTSPAPAPAPSPSAGRNTGKGNFSTRGRYSRSNRSSSSSSLYWSCGYCSFQSLSQAEIKEHSNVKHPGKPHRYVALIKNMTPETAIHPSPRGNLARCANKPIQVQDESSTEYDGSSSVQQSSEDQTNGEGVVSLKEGTDSPNLLKVKFNTPKAVSNTVLRCYHCPYTAKRHSSMKSHIYYRHRGKGLVAVDDESDSGDQVFFCARDDCTFKSESGLLFLQHVDQCTPWNKPELADVEVEPHIRECLEQTITFAEMAREKVNT